MELENVTPTITTAYALKGDFDGVSYFMTTLTLAECREQLHLENTYDVKSFRDRVQRTLDIGRATEIFESYLKKAQLRFFNSLVAVLIPAKGSTNGYYEFEPFRADGKDLPFGMLKIATSIQRVVVDGQHRLYALKLAEEYSRTIEYDESLGLKEITVPIVFLTFQSSGGEGFKTKYEQLDQGVSDCARRLFVDLNKNAKKADKNTLYILDDTDFSAVTARDLIETKPDLERFTRWHGSGTTLTDTDHCFTTIEILNSMIEQLLGDVEEEVTVQYNLTLEEERKEAISKYFDAAISNDLEGMSPSQFIDLFFSRIDFFGEWRERIKETLGQDPLLQPSPQATTLQQRKSIKEMRQDHLLATVIGQKVAFNALLDSFRHFNADSGEENLRRAITKLNHIVTLGLYSRTNPLWGEFLVRPGNKMKLTAYAASVKLLRGLIEGHAPSEMQSLFDDWRESEGVGTNDTLSSYTSAIERLK